MKQSGLSFFYALVAVLAYRFQRLNLLDWQTAPESLDAIVCAGDGRGTYHLVGPVRDKGNLSDR